MLREIIAQHKAGVLGGKTYVLTLANKGLKMAFNPASRIPGPSSRPAKRPSRASSTAASK